MATALGRQRAFSLIEIMVAVALLAVIIVGLLAMFYQVQRAFKGGTAQVDVMEGGRATTSLIVRETQEAVGIQSDGLLDGVTNLAVVPPVNPPTAAVVGQALPGGETRENYLRDFFFLSRANDEWIGTAYRISNAVSGVGTLYRWVERTNLANVASLARNLATLTPYDANANFRRVVDGVVHFRVDLYDTNGWNFVDAIQDYPAPLTNGMLPVSIEVQLALLEPVPLEKFRYRYDANPVQARTYLANQAARTHVFRQRVPIRAARLEYLE